MQKRCSNCARPYWARWRNEPVELCDECRGSAVLCSSCSQAIAPPDDPTQLQLFPQLPRRTPSRVESPTLEERYWSLRAKATQATRRRYPYC